MSTKQLRYIILSGLFMVPFIPLVVSKTLLFPFISGKAFVFRIIVEIVFALWLWLILLDKEYRPKFSWVSLAVTVFVLVIGVADFFGVNPTKSFWSNFERMEGFLALVHLWMYFLVISSILTTKESWKRFFGTSLFASFIMAIYSFLQIAGKITINQGGVRVDGTFGNATYLGIYMVFHIFLAGYLFLNSRNAFSKYILAFVTVLNVVILYYTATRGAILGLLGGTIVTFILLLIKSEKGDNIRKVALVFIVAISALVGVFLMSRNNSYIRTNPVLGRFATLSFSEIKTQGRYFVWPIAFKGFLENPVLGWGQEGFNFVFNKYYNPKMFNQEPWFDRTHNIVLDWLVAGGLVGLLSYLSILLALFFTLIRKSTFSKSERAVLLGLVLAYIFHNLFVFDQIGSYILFFSILGFAHASSESSSPMWIKNLSSKFSIFAKEGFLPVTTSFIVIFFVYMMYVVNFVPWKENKNIMAVLMASSQSQVLPLESYKKPLASNTLGFPEAVEHVSQSVINVGQNPQADQQLKTDLFSVMDTAFHKQLAIAPTDARYHLFYGLFLSSFGKSEEAFAAFKEASKFSPNKQSIYFETGSILINAGKKNEAVAEFKKAYDLEPSYEEARLLYGLSALAAGQTALGNELINGVNREKIIFDDRYISVLANIGRFDEVINIAKERVEKAPTNMQYRITLTAAYLQAGQRQNAIQTLREMIVLDPSFKEKGDYYIAEIQAGRNP